MGIAISLREGYSAGDLRRLAKASKDANQSRRLLALAEIYAGGSRTRATDVERAMGQWSWQTGGLKNLSGRSANSGHLKSVLKRSCVAGRPKAASDRRNRLIVWIGIWFW